MTILLAALLLAQGDDEKRLLYVASPGIRNYVEWGGMGVLIYDIDDGRKLLRRIASLVGPGGGMLLGFDLRKDLSVLLPAYDDARGVTAAFNLNLLARINRELGADFDLSSFRHRAAYNAILSSNPVEPLPPEYPEPVAFFTVTFFYNESPG